MTVRHDSGSAHTAAVPARGVARVVIAALLASVVVMAATPKSPTYAVGGTYHWERFEPGNIISDSLYYDSHAMDADEIQSFLDSKVQSCSSSSTNPCLKDFTGTIESRDSTNRCDAIPRQENRSAAEMIETVSLACGISPKVILVTLQKEQSFVTSTRPTDRMYQIAMGYACPDTAPCNSLYYGFFNQIYSAASQMIRYKVESHRYNFRANRTYEIKYGPQGSCGTRTVRVENWATAAIYNYTPYTPSGASLRAYPGSISSGCFSYGNRNFFAIYSIWFGSTTDDGALLRIGDNSTWWLISGDERWRIPPADDSLKDSIAPLGQPTSVSLSYMTTFENMGDFRGVAKSPADSRYFLLDGGKRHVVRTCAKLEDMGLSCDAAPVLPWSALTPFDLTPDMTGLVAIEGEGDYYLSDATKRPVHWKVSPAAAGIFPSDPVDFERPELFSDIPVGDPLEELNLQRIGTNDTWWVIVRDERWRVPPAASELKQTLSGVYGDPVSVTLADILRYSNEGDFRGIARSPSDSRYFLLDDGGRHVVSGCSSMVDFGLSCQDVPRFTWSSLAQFELMPELRGHVSLGSQGDFLLTGGQKRSVASPAVADAHNLVPRDPVNFESTYIFDGIPEGEPLPQGSPFIHHIGTNDTWWVIIGDERWRVHHDADDLKENLAPLGEPRSVSLHDMLQYSNEGDFRGIARSPSDSRYFLLDDGKRHVVRTCGKMRDFGISCGDVPAFDWAMLTNYELTPDLEGHVTIGEQGDYWLANGQKRLVPSAAAAEANSVVPAVPVPFVHTYLFDSIEEGPPLEP